MGIPSYFSYIIKNHSNIIRSLQYHQAKTAFAALYMDCNSIIYDAFRDIEKNYSPQQGPIETLIINTVIANIRKYVYMIKPSEYLYIAFDGVAPFAKMEQQRTRRYKSQFMTQTSETSTTNPIWNSAAITPGTNFMNTLSEKIAQEFRGKEKQYGIRKIVVSGSVEPGEGEHKMCEHMRRHPLTEKNAAVYGLDSDLIMLSIFHLHYYENIYIFRESPVFGDVAKQKTPTNLPLFLDVKQLCDSIQREMECANSTPHRIYDYVFLCFFLGNDFLPHFPALNIRTHGIQVLLDTYRNIIGKTPNKYLIDPSSQTIAWKNLYELVKDLAKNEYSFLTTEYTARAKLDHRKWADKTVQDRADIFNNAPIIFRTEEKYICPQEPYWEDRYYKALFHENKSPVFLKRLSINYIEGLEWVYTYYTKGCPDWKWKYNYHYPPLLVDLVSHIPHQNTTTILSQKNSTQPFSPYTQLAYVLPPSQLKLLPCNMQTFLQTNYPHLYPDKMEFQWAFCKYFWEAHTTNNPFDLPMLETLDNKLVAMA